MMHLALIIALIVIKYNIIKSKIIIMGTCPKSIRNSSGYLFTIVNTFNTAAYYYYDQNQNIIDLSDTIDFNVPCGSLALKNNDIYSVGSITTTDIILVVFKRENKTLYKSKITISDLFLFNLNSDIYIIGSQNNQTILLSPIEINNNTIITSWKNITLSKEFTSFICIPNQSLLVCAFIIKDMESNVHIIMYDSLMNYEEKYDITISFICITSSFIILKDSLTFSNLILVCVYCDPYSKIKCHMIQLNNYEPYLIEVEKGKVTLTQCKESNYEVLFVDNEIILCCREPKNYKCKTFLYDNANNEIDESKGVTNFINSIDIYSSSYDNYISFIRLKEDLIVLKLYNHKKMSNFFISYLYQVQCEDHNITLANNSWNIPIKKLGSVKEEEVIVFPLLLADTTYGNFYANNELIKAGIPYDDNTKFTFQSNFIKGIVAITYKVQLKNNLFKFTEASCQLSVAITTDCYSSCHDCQMMGNSSNHQCISCKESYYKYLNATSLNCYNQFTKDANWYFRIDFYYDCSKTCLGCTSGEIYSDNNEYHTNCIKCSNNSYPYISLPECRNEQLKESNIYFNASQQKYFKCFKNCASCSQSNNKTSMNCLSCIKGRKYIEDKHNCILDGIISNEGYYKGEYDDYYPCYEKCSKCTTGGSIALNNCLKCKSEYYLITEYLNCILEADIPIPYPGYFADNITRTIYPCYFSCNECNGIGSSIIHHCITCANRFYKQKNTSNCYLSNDILEGYFFNRDSLPFSWDPCGQHCINCKDDKICNKCSIETYLYEDQCITECPINMVINDNQCLLECPHNMTLLTKTCYDIFTSNKQAILMHTQLEIKDLIDIMTIDLLYFNDMQIVIKGKEYTIQLLKKKYEQNNRSNAKEFQLCTIDLVACISKLVISYDIAEDDIIIIKIDYNRTDFSMMNSIQIMFYDVNNTRLEYEKYCKDIDIIIQCPLITAEGIDLTNASLIEKQGYDMFNPKNCFYNDICTPYTNENGQDVTLYHRRIDLYQNVSFCKEKYQFLRVNASFMYVECLWTISSIIPQPETALEFDSINNDSMIQVIFCISEAFSISFILPNMGFWVMLCFIICNVIIFGYIIGRGFKEYISTCQSVQANPNQHKRIIFTSFNKEKGKLKPIQQLQQLQQQQQQQQQEKVLKYITKVSKDNIKTNQFKNKIIAYHNNTFTPNQFITDKDEKLSFFHKISFYYKRIILVKKQFNIIKIIYQFIQLKHPIWYSFIKISKFDYRLFNLVSYITSMGFYIGFNALFSTNYYINEIYKRKGGFHFFISLPKSFYSYFLGSILTFLLRYFLSSGKVFEAYIKKEKIHEKKHQPNDNQNTNELGKDVREEVLKKSSNNSNHNNNNNSSKKHINNLLLLDHNPISTNDNDKQPSHINITTSPFNIINGIQMNESAIIRLKKKLELQKVILQVKIKMILYMIINCFIILFLWIYVSCFCYVMKNSQINWIIESIITILISMIIPFILSIILGIIKFISLKYEWETLFIFNEIFAKIL